MIPIFSEDQLRNTVQKKSEHLVELEEQYVNMEEE